MELALQDNGFYNEGRQEGLEEGIAKNQAEIAELKERNETLEAHAKKEKRKRCLN